MAMRFDENLPQKVAQSVAKKVQIPMQFCGVYMQESDLWALQILKSQGPAADVMQRSTSQLLLSPSTFSLARHSNEADPSCGATVQCSPNTVIGAIVRAMPANVA